MAGAALLVGCDKPPPPPEPERAVKLITVGTERLTASHEYAAEVQARVESRLGFRVAGKITQRAAEVGQRVRAGQVLAQLDARDYQLAAAAARAQVNSAATQRNLAAADLKRYQSLRDQGFISGAEIERRTAQLQSAQATLEQAQAQLSTQGNQARYTSLVADANGVVTGVDAEVGQVVAAGTPVVRIAQDGPRDAVFAVPEDRVGEVRTGQPVEVTTWSDDARLSGTVREVAASADPVTRTFTVKVALAGQAPPLGATVQVLPGRADTAGVASAAAIKLPTSALRREGEGSAVWVFDPDSSTVRLQAVQVVAADGNAAVIGSGLQPGMQVVTSGVHVLAPGQKVSVYKPKTASEQSSQSLDAIKNVATETLPMAAATSTAPAASR
ncbi:efflux RND transporter periplasmic adaptor subunit [Ottowia sp.]|uniref:efflux RND transporter periplasmic adaptor subunit n=1 Tax=Ottowia sp. TaxID=1898956 RepID=UPI003A85C708